MDWGKRFISLFYKDKKTKVTYELQGTERIDIIARFLIHERKVVDLDIYEVAEYGLENNDKFYFIIKSKESTPPPPPPKTTENVNDNQPHRASN
jgi:hypothetical protein